MNGKRSEHSLKMSIAPERWNSKSESAKGTDEASRMLNSFIHRVRGNVEKHYADMVANGQRVTAEAIRDRYLGLDSKDRSLLEAYEEHNLMVQTQATTGNVVEATLGKYKYSKRVLEKFIKVRYDETDIKLIDLKYKFLVDYEFYLRNNIRLSHNTAMTYVKHLKKVVSFAIMNEWLQTHPFVNFKCTTRDTHRGYLTKDELDKIMNIRLEDDTLERVRDVFVFQCYTGYAYTEVRRIGREHLARGIDGEIWCSIQRNKTTSKTIKKSNVPLLPKALEIIEKYKDDKQCDIEGTCLPGFSNSNINMGLKKIARMCGIKKTLTTHMGRHTFATTVTLANGVSIESISSMLGHSEIKTTQIYAKIVDTKVSEDMLKLRERLEGKKKG